MMPMIPGAVVRVPVLKLDVEASIMDRERETCVCMCELHTYIYFVLRRNRFRRLPGRLIDGSEACDGTDQSVCAREK